MKRLLIVCMLLGLGGFGGSTLAAQGEILMTAERSGSDIVLVFEALNEGGVVALQYELNMAGIDPGRVDLSGCVGTFKSSKLAGCHLSADRGILRVGIIDEQLKDIATGEIGRITLRGIKTIPSTLTVTNAAVVDRRGGERSIKPLVDFGGLQSSKPGIGQRVQ